ncbi:glycosyltransferase family 4 protein [Sulfolobus acidocaldarius]|uniref:glycosyltransferase family 4 protein n=1 Tax=Sulfolobus acidocaldarius TaxID=2285 RepID=UPI00234AB028|nr:glycosyltransferase [Sulfolobus acidocaldarius]WCM35720.1 glycosyltransferase [Sulfolobus acidocaldarius DSM 639]
MSRKTNKNITTYSLVRDMLKKVLVVTDPLSPGGASKHAREVLKILPKLGLEVKLYIPFIHAIPQSPEEKERKYLNLKELERNGVEVFPEVWKYLEMEKEKENIFPYLLTLTSGYIPKKDMEFSNDLRENFSLVYDMSENEYHFKVSHMIAKKLHVPLVILLQSESYANSFGRGYRKVLGIKGLFYDLGITYIFMFNRRRFVNALREGVLRGILSVSRAIIKQSKLERLAQDYKVYTNVLKPANAIDGTSISHFRSKKVKENFALYAGRITYLKGIIDLIKIAKETNVKIMLAGSFDNHKEMERLFSKFPPNLVYLGSFMNNELYKIISNSKVTLLPSYKESFSLITMESLALDTPVIAYNLPAINEIYGDIKAVIKIPVGNYKLMAKTLESLMEKDIRELFDPKVEELIKFYSSWEKVAEATLHELENVKNWLQLPLKTYM